MPSISSGFIPHPPGPDSESTMAERDLILSGKVAVITGGGSGIGREIARKYLHAGASVSLAILTKTDYFPSRREQSR